MVSAFLVFCMLFSKALISYSRALTNEATSSSPVVEMAASLDCTEISLISWVFWRFRLAEDVRIAFRLWPSASFVAEVMTLSKSSRGSELTQSSITQESMFSIVIAGSPFSTRRGIGATRVALQLHPLSSAAGLQKIIPRHYSIDGDMDGFFHKSQVRMGVSRIWYTLRIPRFQIPGATGHEKSVVRE